MHALITLILATVVIAIRRTTRASHVVHAPPSTTQPIRPMPPVSPSQPRWHQRGSVRLLGRALTGMVIALTIIGFSNFPWPVTAGVWSAAMAADIATLQATIWQHRDLVVIASTSFWMLVPIWVLAIRLGLREGRALLRITYLVPLWCYHQGRLVFARTAICPRLRYGVIQPLWGLVTRLGHHGWWLIRFGVWSIRRTLVWCYRGAR